MVKDPEQIMSSKDARTLQISQHNLISDGSTVWKLTIANMFPPPIIHPHLLTSTTELLLSFHLLPDSTGLPSI